ncbi:hypothetical protein ACVWXO_005611 [Bradyrhizobium sp. LM2.7]
MVRHRPMDGRLLSVPPTEDVPRIASNRFAAWLVLIGIATPSSITVLLGGAKFTPSRIIICLLLVSGLAELFRRGRHLCASDAFVCAASAWMFVATSQTDESWSSTAALVVEFGGGYMVARSYFFGRPALETFVGVLKPIAIGLIALAFLEHLTARNIPAALFGLPHPGHEYRYGLLRAFSTFPHPILYGAFCTSAGAILLYSERSSLRRIGYAALCFFGCVLSMSSAPLLAFMIVISVHLYGRIMRPYHWRWRLLLSGLFAFLAVVCFAANKPVSWIVANLTLDPSTGYFRVATWDSALYYIGFSPYAGYGFSTYASADDFFANASVDCVWLTMALRFGIPLLILILMANITSFWNGRAASMRSPDHSYMADFSTGFTLALVALMFVGLTVHYWNNIWMYWGVCIGIRASLQEQRFNTAASLTLHHRGSVGQIDPSVAIGQRGAVYRLR